MTAVSEDKSTEFIAYCSINNTETDGDEESTGGLRRLNKINKRNKKRKLAGISISCYYYSPKKEGYYMIKSIHNNENITLELSSGIIVTYLSHCISIEEAEEISNIFLSFRQANSFKIDEDGNGQFNLYALTTKSIDKSYTVILECNIGQPDGLPYIRNNNTICKPSSSVEISESGIAPVHFLCEIDVGEINATSLVIIGSEQLRDIYSENHIIDLALTDKKITEGTLPNMSDPKTFEDVPPLIKIERFNLDNIKNKSFEIIATVEGGISD